MVHHYNMTPKIICGAGQGLSILCLNFPVYHRPRHGSQASTSLIFYLFHFFFSYKGQVDCCGDVGGQLLVHQQTKRDLIFLGHNFATISFSNGALIGCHRCRSRLYLVLYRSLFFSYLIWFWKGRCLLLPPPLCYSLIID